MGEQLSLKAAIPLAEILATCRKNVSNTGPRKTAQDRKVGRSQAVYPSIGISIGNGYRITPAGNELRDWDSQRISSVLMHDWDH